MFHRLAQAYQLRRDRSGLRAAQSHDADAAATRRCGDGSIVSVAIEDSVMAWNSVEVAQELRCDEFVDSIYKKL